MRDKKNSNLDNNLTNIVYNIDGVNNIIRNNEIRKVFFSSRFVENKFKRLFQDLVEEYPHIDLVYLPSPSPRYAAMSRQDKIKKYKEVLPTLNNT